MLITIKDFVVEARIQNLEIDAESEEDALEILRGMTLEELVHSDAYVDDIEYKDVESEISEYDFDAEVTNIEYDLDDWDLSGTEFESVEELAESLPKELDVAIRCCEGEDDESDMISDEIYDVTHHKAKSFEYKVVKRY